MTPYENYKKLYESLPPGWLHEDEGWHLLQAAGATTGSILEVGCYNGRSTVLLASLGRPMHCVDPFEGFCTEDPSGVETRRKFIENIRNHGNILLYEQRIEDWTPRPCGFAYLDGDHTEEGTRQQIIAAIKCQVSAVAIHDCSSSGGGLLVKKAAESILGTQYKLVGTMAVWGPK